MRNKSYEERLAGQNLLIYDSEERLLLKTLEMFIKVEASKLFSLDNTSRTRSSGEKLRCKEVQLSTAKFFFTNDVVNEWNKLPPSVVQCDAINSFKNKLDHHLLNQDIR